MKNEYTYYVNKYKLGSIISTNYNYHFILNNFKQILHKFCRATHSCNPNEVNEYHVLKKILDDLCIGYNDLIGQIKFPR